MIKQKLAKEITDMINTKFALLESQGVDGVLTDDAIIFGGVMREGIAEGHLDNTEDLDIIVSESSVEQLMKNLAIHSYSRNKSLEKMVKRQEGIADEQKAYNPYACDAFDLYIMTRNKSRIDLVIPNKDRFELPKHFSGFMNQFAMNLYYLSNVDMSCSMVGYNKHMGLVMRDEKVIDLMKRKVYSLNTESILYKKERTDERMAKLEKRGWMSL